MSRGIYWFTVLSLVTAFLLCQNLVNGKTGKILIALRDGENRTRFIGYNPVLGKMLTRRSGALAMNPKIFLLDEPIQGIQPSVAQEIEYAIQTIKKKREIAVLLVEQSLEFATTIADHTCIMDKGTIVAQGSPNELFEEMVRGHSCWLN